MLAPAVAVGPAPGERGTPGPWRSGAARGPPDDGAQRRAGLHPTTRSRAQGGTRGGGSVRNALGAIFCCFFSKIWVPTLQNGKLDFANGM